MKSFGALAVFLQLLGARGFSLTPLDHLTKASFKGLRFPFVANGQGTHSQDPVKSRFQFDKACSHFVYDAVGKTASIEPHLSDRLSLLCHGGTEKQCNSWIADLISSMKLDERESKLARADLADVIANKHYNSWCEKVYDDVTSVADSARKKRAAEHIILESTTTTTATTTTGTTTTVTTTKATSTHSSAVVSTTVTTTKATSTTTTARTTTTKATTTTTTTTTTSTTTTKVKTTTTAKKQLITTPRPVVSTTKAGVHTTTAAKVVATTTHAKKQAIAKEAPTVTHSAVQSHSVSKRLRAQVVTNSTAATNSTSKSECVCVHHHGKKVCHCLNEHLKKHKN